MDFLGWGKIPTFHGFSQGPAKPLHLYDEKPFNEPFFFNFKDVGAEAIKIPATAQVRWGSSQLPFWSEENDETFSCYGDDFALSLNLATRRGEVLITNPVGWRNVLRVIFFFTFLEHDGILLHAGGLVRNGRAYVCVGPSEAGKTTIVRHSPGLPVLSDEVVAVSLATDGGALAWGTPFYGDYGQPGERRVDPVKGLFFPVKSEIDRLIPLNPAEILSRLLPCVLTYTTLLPRQRKLFDIAARLAETVPGYALHFRSGPDFWQVIDES